MKLFISLLLPVLIIFSLLSGCRSYPAVNNAAISGNIENLKSALQEEKKVDQVDYYGFTALCWATYYGNYGIINYLVNQGADINFRTTIRYGDIWKGSTPLIIASYYGYENVVRLLLSKNAERSITNDEGSTALDYAVRFDFAKIASLLKTKGAQYTKPAKKTQIILLTDGSRMVGEIIKQTRTSITIKTKYTTMTIQKDKVKEILYK